MVVAQVDAVLVPSTSWFDVPCAAIVVAEVIVPAPEVVRFPGVERLPFTPMARVVFDPNLTSKAVFVEVVSWIIKALAKP